MSQEVNTKLIEEAQGVIEYFNGKVLATVIEEDIKTNDLEALAKHVKEGRDIMFNNEYTLEPGDTF